MANFVHLHLHTEYSLVDGMVTIDPLIDALKTLKMPAVAITDLSNIFGSVKFYQAAVAAGIKPIIGAELYIYIDETLTNLILLCQNKTGYLNLCHLLSRAYTQGQQGAQATLERDWLHAHTDGLIAILPMQTSDIALALKKTDRTLANARLAAWQDHFPGRLYLEVTRTGKPHEEALLLETIEFAGQHQMPIVASNDVRFIAREDFEAHEARVCIHRGDILNNKKRRRDYSDRQYLASPDDMAALFADLPEAIENTLHLAKRCNFAFEFGQTYLPDFPTPNGLPLNLYIEKLASAGLQERLQLRERVDKLDITALRPAYEERLQRELTVINDMGFAGYFLIVADFIQWAKNTGIPVGPGRGSGAGSLVAYVLKITDLDPLKYDLLFERFLNPERVSMPDFDIDFCMAGRDRVIDYVAQKYGRASVSQIITFGTMAAKAVVRDVGRVLNHGYGFVDSIAKLIPFELGMTLDKALTEPALKDRYDNDEEVRAIIDLAKKLEGVARNAGKHAGGVVIAPGQLSDFTAVYCEAGSTQIVSQFDKDDIEKIGLVKFDFLGLRTLTIIDWALQTINARLPAEEKSTIDIQTIPLADEATFQLLQACNTTAVFQLESRGMKDLIKRLQPDCFEDIIALVALFRPGPLQSGMVEDFIARKHGRQTVTYPHPALETILKETYGVILYQEQVMQIAQDLAGYTLGAADILRRAMGKKKAEEMAEQRQFFTQGAEKNGVDPDVAAHIFDLMEKFAGYGFNKSHSAAYALIAYQTAWLKTHYTAEFMAAVLSSDMDNTDKVVNFIEDCKTLGITLLPPDINHSEYKFTATDEQTILFGLGAIKGAGESALAGLIQARHESGRYTSFYDLCHRLDTHKVNKRVFEVLIKSGSLDALGPDRATLLASLPRFIQAAEQHGRNQTNNQTDLFGSEPACPKHLEPTFITPPPWPENRRLQYEKETLGFYFSGHPLDEIREELAAFTTTSLDKLKQHQGKTALVAGIISSFRAVRTKRGDRMAIFTLDDGKTKVDAIAFSDIYQKHRDLFATDHIVVVRGDVTLDEYTENYRLTVSEAFSLQGARLKFARFLQIEMQAVHMSPETINTLKQILSRFPGKMPVYIHYTNQQARTLMPLGEAWRISPETALFEALKQTLDLSAHCAYGT